MAKHKISTLQDFILRIEVLESFVPDLMFGIKNLDSNIEFFSKAHAKFLGINISDILGKKTYQKLYDDHEIDRVLVQEDRLVIKNKQTIHLLKIHKVCEKLKPHICIKYPVLNDVGDVIGILFQTIEISMYNFGEYLVDAHKYEISANSGNLELPHLTKREQQVVYLFMNNFTSLEIADAIGQIEGKKISKSAIDNLFNDQLYKKFNVHNRPALLKILQKTGQNNLVPNSLLSSGSRLIHAIAKV